VLLLLLLMLPPFGAAPSPAAAIGALMRGGECARVWMGAFMQTRACQLLQMGRGGELHGSADGTRCRRPWQEAQGRADHAVDGRAAAAFLLARFIVVCNSCSHASPFRAHQRSTSYPPTCGPILSPS